MQSIGLGWSGRWWLPVRSFSGMTGRGVGAVAGFWRWVSGPTIGEHHRQIMRHPTWSMHRQRTHPPGRGRQRLLELQMPGGRDGQTGPGP